MRIERWNTIPEQFRYDLCDESISNNENSEKTEEKCEAIIPIEEQTQCDKVCKPQERTSNHMNNLILPILLILISNNNNCI